jgi:serine/threonine protein kinase
MKSESASGLETQKPARPPSPLTKADAVNPNSETTELGTAGLTSRILSVGAQPGEEQAAKVEPPAKSPAAPPKQLGRFRIQKLLGQGGMGSVYLAHDDQLDRPVALKIPRLPDDAESAKKLLARFLREARAAATLNHPNICPIYDVGQDGGMHFIAMAFVKGQPLANFITSGKPQSTRQVALVMRKAALALQEAHRHGILHRDLKPANIMIDERGEPIVMDFGLACRLDQDWESRLTQDGKVVGTPTYMSPEQIDGRCEVGPASDVYSLGVVMYELLSGTCPFTGSLVSVIGQVLNVEPKPVRELRPDAPDELAEICQRAMAKDRSKRFATMQEFADALTEFLKSTTTTVISRPTVVDLSAPNNANPFGNLQNIDALLGPPTTDGTTLATTTLRKRRARSWTRSPWAWGAGAFGAVVVAIVLISLTAGKSDDSSGQSSTSAVALKTAGASSPPVAKADAQSTTSVAPDTTSASPAETATQQSSLPTTGPVVESPVNPAPAAQTVPAQPAATASPAAASVGSANSIDSTSATATKQAIAEPSSPAVKSAAPSTTAQPQPSAAQPTLSSSPPSHATPTDKLAADRQPPLDRSPPPNGSFGSQRPTPPPFPGGPNGPPNFANVDFSKINSVEALEDFFNSADHNKDGKLDRTELPMHIIFRAAKSGQNTVTLSDLKKAFKKLGEKLFAPPTVAEQRRLQRMRPGPPPPVQ